MLDIFSKKCRPISSACGLCCHCVSIKLFMGFTYLRVQSIFMVDIPNKALVLHQQKYDLKKRPSVDAPPAYVS